MRITGGALRTALAVASMVVWAGAAPAGAQAVTNGQIVGVVHDGGAQTDQLVTLNADGTGRRTLATFPYQSLESPAWSPEGNRIAFALTKPFPSRIYTYDLASGKVSEVTHPPFETYQQTDTAPSWSPDGTRMAFARTQLPLQILTVGADGSDERRVFELGTVPFGPLIWERPAWSPTGGQIAFFGGAYSFDVASWVEALYTISPEGTGFVTVFEEAGPDGSRQDPQWSPDGRRVVFTDWRGPGANLRVVEPVAGGVPSDLTPKTDSRGDYESDWSPDGAWVLFRRNYELMRVSADGSVTEPVLKQSAIYGPLVTEADWQPCVAGVTVSCASAAPGSTPVGGGAGGGAGADAARQRGAARPLALARAPRPSRPRPGSRPVQRALHAVAPAPGEAALGKEARRPGQDPHRAGRPEHHAHAGARAPRPPRAARPAPSRDRDGHGPGRRRQRAAAAACGLYARSASTCSGVGSSGSSGAAERIRASKPGSMSRPSKA